MPAFSLKYRIAVVIFVLEAIMMVFVINTMLSTSLNSYRSQLHSSEHVLEGLLKDLGHMALVTGEYDELQAYIERIVQDPHVVTVHLANNKGRIVASSKTDMLGKPLPAMKSAPEDVQVWRNLDLHNLSRHLGILAINYSQAALLDTNRKVQNTGLTIAVIGMSIIAIVGTVIGYLLTRRLETLTNAATQLARGEPAIKTEFRGNDEIAMLGRAFDSMATSIEGHIAELQNGREKLRQAYDDLEQRVAQRTQELAIARDAALQASRTKSVFLANMSHELRTPLNAIIGYSDLVQEDALENGYGKIIDDVKKISKAGHHLLSLISDILDLSKIEAGKMELNMGKVEVEPLIRDIQATIATLVEQRNNTLSIEIEGQLGFIDTDITRIRQVLFNLLSNACKFTEQGHITLSACNKVLDQREYVSFRVRDTGIGMTSGQISRVFDEFSQADQSTTRKYGGTGLGLAICKKLTLAMGGTIQVESQPNTGTTFTVNIPKTGAMAA
jgi:signal transduction histidine kinase